MDPATLVEGITWDFETFPEYLDLLRTIPKRINVGAMVPHSMLRLYVMGADSKVESRSVSLGSLQDDGLRVILTGLNDRSVIVNVSYSGDLANGEKVIQPLRTLAKPVSDTVHRSAYAEITPEDEGEQPGFAFGKYCYFERLSDAAIEGTIAQFTNQSDVSCGMGLYHYMHGAICRVARDATAFELRAPGALHIAIASSWHDAKMADASMAWVNSAWGALNTFSGGRIYANYLSVEGEDAVKAAFGKNYSKLAQIKKKYDPSNFFRLNPNIRPRPS